MIQTKGQAREVLMVLTLFRFLVILQYTHTLTVLLFINVLGPKLLLVMVWVKLGN